MTLFDVSLILRPVPLRFEFVQHVRHDQLVVAHQATGDDDADDLLDDLFRRHDAFILERVMLGEATDRFADGRLIEVALLIGVDGITDRTGIADMQANNLRPILASFR